MESGEIAAWLAAIFAFATFSAWVFDKWRDKLNAPSGKLDAKLYATMDDGEKTRNVARITNQGEAPILFLDDGAWGMRFSHARLYLAKGYMPPKRLASGGEFDVLLEDVDAQNAYVKVTHHHPRFRWVQVEWHALQRHSGADNELDKQLGEASALRGRKQHRHLRSGPVGPGGVPRVVLNPKSRAFHQELGAATGEGPVQPYMKWWKRPRLWGILTKPFRRRSPAPEAPSSPTR